MTCRASFTIDNNQVEAMNLTLSITLTVAQWRTIRKDLMDAKDHTALNVRSAIQDAMLKVDALAGQEFEVEG